jgi:hypothetical protein
VNRLRATLGVIAGVLMLLSSAAHSLLGWPALTAKLAETHAPADLVQGLAVGWHFGGAAMLTFACIVLWLFGRALRGRAVSLMPARIITVLYLAFGAGALAITRDPFFMVFIVPGALLAIASFARGDAGGRPS